MDPRDRKPRSPSLMDEHDLSTSSARPPIGNAAARTRTSSVLKTSGRGWAWGAVAALIIVVAIGLLAIGGMFDAGSHAPRPTPKMVAPPSQNLSAMAGPDLASAEQAAPASNANSAVILADVDDDNGLLSSGSSAAASSTARSTAALSEMFAPHASKPVRHRHVSRTRHHTPDDSDVDLLTALIKHVEVTGPVPHHSAKSPRKRPASASASDVEEKMRACPAANTEAGVRCRERICRGHAGQAVACPASTPDGA